MGTVGHTSLMLHCCRLFISCQIIKFQRDEGCHLGHDVHHHPPGSKWAVGSGHIGEPYPSTDPSSIPTKVTKPITNHQPIDHGDVGVPEILHP